MLLATGLDALHILIFYSNFLAFRIILRCIWRINHLQRDIPADERTGVTVYHLADHAEREEEEEKNEKNYPKKESLHTIVLWLIK